MLKNLCALSLALTVFCGIATAGPSDPSSFDATPYKPQKALYDFNFAKPMDAKTAFGYVKNHLQALRQYGDANIRTS